MSELEKIARTLHLMADWYEGDWTRVSAYKVGELCEHLAKKLDALVAKDQEERELQLRNLLTGGLS